jgi:hypothetical protein
MKTRLVTLVAALAIAGCAPPDDGSRWLGSTTEVAAPAAPGSQFPHLAAAADGTVVMSWLEPAGDGVYALRYATWNGSGWNPPGTVATGSDWFVNWADFPSVVPVGEHLWAAHWLQQKPGGVYSYDVRIAVSNDAGHSWSSPMSPHDDGTATEHGFVSLYGDDGVVHAVWLDGRRTSGEHDHGGGASGAMTLRGAALDGDGRRIGTDREIDARVCDCCQTDVAATDEGPVVVYRDRSEREVRDIAAVRRTSDGWSAPFRVHDDHWTIDACPVNGPAIAALGRTVVIAWFTAPDRPRVRVAYSNDSGRTFSPPIEVASGKVAGRVDVALLEDGRAVVSWLEDRSGVAEIRAQIFTAEGAAAPAATVARSNVARSSGFPQMVPADGGLLFAWTRPGEPSRVLTAFADLP